MLTDEEIKRIADIVTENVVCRLRDIMASEVMRCTPDEEIGELIAAKEICSMLNISINTFYARRYHEKIPCILTAEHRKLYRKSDVVATIFRNSEAIVHQMAGRSISSNTNN